MHRKRMPQREHTCLGMLCQHRGLQCHLWDQRWVWNVGDYGGYSACRQPAGEGEASLECLPSSGLCPCLLLIWATLFLWYSFATWSRLASGKLWTYHLPTSASQMASISSLCCQAWLGLSPSLLSSESTGPVPQPIRIPALSQATLCPWLFGFCSAVRVGKLLASLSGRLTSVLRSKLKMDFPIEQSRALCFLCSVINRLSKPRALPD